MKIIHQLVTMIVVVAGVTLAALPAMAGCTGSSTNMTCTSGSISLGATGAGATSNAVSGLSGTLSSITVQLNGFTHNSPEYLGFLLVAPDGSTNLVFLSDAVGYNAISNLTLNFSDSASSFIPGGGTQAGSGTYKPTSATTDGAMYDSGYAFSGFNGTAKYSAPLASGTLNATFAGLTGTKLNGTWELYITDIDGSMSGDSGSLSSYSITITTTASSVGTNTAVSASPSQIFTSSPSNTSTITATVTANSSPVTSGTVGFTDNGTAIAGENAVALNPSGQASFTYTATTGTAEGMHTIVATYSGATDDLGSNGSTGLEVDNHPTISGSQVCNGPITLGGLNQPSSPYGSRLYVPSSFDGTISAVTLYLDGMTSTYEASFALLLASPGGSKFFVPMDVIGYNSMTNYSVSGVNLTLEDAGGSLMPSGAQLNSGTFLPTAYLISNTLTPFPSPAPSTTASNYAAPTGSATFASTFGGLDTVGTAPNNYWDLFVTNSTGNTGTIQKWCLSFVTSNAPSSTTAVSPSKNPSFVGDTVIFTATVTSGGNAVTQGTVTFLDGSTTVQGPTALSGSGTATYTTSSLTEGTHVIQANYSGAPGVANVSSGMVSEEVDNHTVISNGGLTFCNPGTITLPNLSSTATPYPSRIFVSNLPGTLNSLSVAMNGFTRPDPSGTAVLLAGPQIQNNTFPENLVLFSEAGDNNGNGGAFSVSNVNLTFQDGHSALPQFAQIVAGTYGTSFYQTYGTVTFPTPAPSTFNSTGTIASEFGSSEPNGTWQLFAATPFQGTGDGTFGSWCMTFSENAPSLTVTKTSGGSFTQGSTTGQFTISVKNNGPGPTGGPTAVTVTDSLPTGITATAISASNWTCTSVFPASSISCSRSDALASGSSYDNIVLTVSVAANATPGNTTNTASVTGGGSASNVAGSAMVNVIAAPVLSLSKAKVGTFTQGSTGEWDLTVSDGLNAGATSSAVTVVDTLPTGYTVSGFSTTSGTWSCAGTGTATATCMTTANGLSTFPTIKIIVNIPASSAVSVTNNAVVFGGGDLTHTNSSNGAMASSTVSVVQVPASVSVVSGSGQSTNIGTAFASPLVALVQDAAGVAISGVTVTFTAPSSSASGTFASTSTNTSTAITGSNGQATSSTFTANSTLGGPYNVVASVPGATSANFSLTNATFVIIASAGNPQSTGAGSAFTYPLEVTVTDSSGNYISGAVVTFTGSASFVSFSSPTATTGSDGRASITATATATSGSYNVTATLSSGASATFTLANVNTNAASGPCVVTSSGDDNSAGTLRYQVAACGKGGTITFANTVTNVLLAQPQDIQLTQDLTIEGGQIQGSGQSRIFFIAGGNITLQGMLLYQGNAQGGSGGIGGYGGGGAAGMGGAIFVNAGELTLIGSTLEESQAQGGTGGANTGAGYGGDGGVGGNGGGNQQNNSHNGGGGGDFGSSGGSGLDGSGGNGLGVANGGSGTSNGGFGGGGGAYGSAGFGGGSAASGSAGAFGGSGVFEGGGGAGLGGAIFVRNGLLVLQNSTFVLNGAYGANGAGNNGQGKGGALFIMSTATALSLGTNTIAENTASNPGTGTACNSVVGATAVDTSGICGILTQVTLSATSGGGQSAAVGTAFTNQLVATVSPAVAGIPVVFSGPGTGASINPVSVTAITNASGVASASVAANATLGQYTVATAIGGVATTATFSLTNTVGAPASMTANSSTTQSTAVGTAFTAPSVIVKDALSNPVPGVTVTFTAPSTGASGTFSNSSNTITVMTNSSGIASAAFTANSTAGGPYNVTAASNGLTSVTFSFTNTAGAAASMTANSSTTQSATVGTAFTAPSVIVKDASSNPVSGVSVTFTAPSTGASGTFSNSSNTITVITNAAGIATASFTANTTAGGAYNVTAASNGLTSVTFSFTNTAGAAASMTANSATTESATVGTAFTAPSVIVKDQYGNVVSGVSVTFSAPTTGASGTFPSGATTTTNSSGIASVAFTANSTAGGPYNVTAASNGLTSVTFNFTNTAGAAASMTANSSATQSATVNTAFSVGPSVIVKDALSNPVSGVSVTFTAPATGASGTFSNSTNTITVMTNSSGIASATFTANTTAGGPYSVTAASNGLTTVTFNFSNNPGAASHFSVSAPTTAFTSTSFNFTVTALDQYNNVATSYTGTVHFTTTALSATLPLDYTFTSGSGTHTFSATLNSTGNQTISATDTGNASIMGTSGTISVSPSTVQVMVGTNTTGASFTVDSTTYTSAQTLTWNIGSMHTIATTSPQTISSTQYTFSNWSDSGAISHSVTASSATTSYTANFSVSAFANGYEHYRAITISHTEVAANQTNFPVLVTGTFPYLATIANGGFLQNANGYDAVFTSDMAGTMLLNWEVEQYNPVTGAATYWVRVPNLSSTTDTTIYLYYDNPAITTFQGNKTGTWDSNFIAVYHASDNAANRTVSDSTANANNATANFNSNTLSTPLGKIDGALNFGGVTEAASSGSSLNLTNTFTLEGWVNLNAWPNAGYGGYLGSKGNQYFVEFTSDNSGANHGIVVGTLYSTGNFFAGTAVSEPTSFEGTFHHVAGSWDGANWNLYVDGAVAAQTASGQAPYQNPEPFTLGAQTYDTSGDVAQFVNGILDEVRVSNIARSASWVATEYHNQSNPPGFYMVGADTTPTGSTQQVSVTVSPQAPINLIAGQKQSFTATVTGNSNTAVTWSITGPGSIDQLGNYTAPTPIVSGQTSVTVTATSVAVTTQSGSATVTLIPVGVSINTPTTTTLGASQQVTLMASVTGTSNTAVTWSVVGGGPGSVNQSGVYTAPTGIASATTATVKAVSQADSTMSAMIVLNLIPVSVTVSPMAKTLGPNGTQSFTATVAGATNPAVVWSVSPPTGAGTIDNAGNYIAPATITATTATITATSVQDNTKSGSATVTLMAVSGACPAAANNSWTGCYYSDQAFTTLVTSRNDPYIQFPSSGAGVIPTGVESVRWQGNFSPFQGAEYNFYVTTDYEATMYIDGVKVFDSTVSTPVSPNNYIFTLGVTAGAHLVELDYVHNPAAAAVVSLGWGTR